MFDSNVAPLLQSKCASCHAGTGTTVGPTFLGLNQGTFYGKLTSDSRFVNDTPAKSLLITKGPHEGPAFSTAEGDAITAWLTQEVVERGASLGTAPPAVSAAAAELDKFGKCMALADFNSTGMADVHNQNVNGNGGTCDSCHQTGQYVLLAANATQTFNAMKQVPYLLKFAVADTNPDGSFKDVIAANRFIDRGKEPGHPSFTMTTARATAITNFFQATYTKYKAGNCP